MIVLAASCNDFLPAGSPWIGAQVGRNGRSRMRRASRLAQLVLPIVIQSAMPGVSGVCEKKILSETRCNTLQHSATIG